MYYIQVSILRECGVFTRLRLHNSLLSFQPRIIFNISQLKIKPASAGTYEGCVTVIQSVEWMEGDRLGQLIIENEKHKSLDIEYYKTESVGINQLSEK